TATPGLFTLDASVGSAVPRRDAIISAARERREQRGRRCRWLFSLSSRRRSGERGSPCKHWPNVASVVSKHPSPLPSPRCAGRGYSKRGVVQPAVSFMLLVGILNLCSVSVRCRFTSP